MGKRTGFALLSPEQRKERASQGGRAAQAKGTARRWDSQEAALAGRKGGESSAKRRRDQQRYDKEMETPT
jgi:general stress protein YciG